MLKVRYRCDICGELIGPNEDRMEYVLYLGDVRTVPFHTHAACEGY